MLKMRTATENKSRTADFVVDRAIMPFSVVVRVGASYEDIILVQIESIQKIVLETLLTE